MIKKVKYSEIDFEKYTTCIESSVQSTLYAKKEILDQLSGNWEILMEGDYDAVMPLHIKRKWGLDFVLMPLFCQQLGVYSKTDSPKQNEKFLQFLENNYRIFSYHFNSKNQFAIPIARKKNYEINVGDYKEVRKKYFKGRKSTVKSARFLRVEKMSLHDEVEWYIRKNMKGLEKKSDLAFFLKYISYLDSKNLLQLYATRKENQLSSLAIVLEDKNENYLLALVNDQHTKSSNGPSFVIDQILQSTISKKRFNFMGSSIRGIEVFFKSFGGENHDFPCIVKGRAELIRSIFR